MFNPKEYFDKLLVEKLGYYFKDYKNKTVSTGLLKSEINLHNLKFVNTNWNIFGLNIALVSSQVDKLKINFPWYTISRIYSVDPTELFLYDTRIILDLDLFNEIESSSSTDTPSSNDDTSFFANFFNELKSVFIILFLFKYYCFLFML
jgi:hypothetical protein